MTSAVGSSAVAALYGAIVDIVILKGALIPGLAAFACFGLRHASAAARHAVWASAFVVLLAIPVARLVTTTPRVTVVGASAAAPATAPLVGTDGPSAPPVAVPTAEPRAGLPRGTVRTEPSRPPAMVVGLPAAYSVLAAVWLGGVVLCLARVASHLRALRRLTSRAGKAPPEIRDRVRAVARELGLRRTPVVLVSDELAAPATCGLMRTKLALPADVTTWPRGRLEAALVHELAHLRRRDYAVYLVVALVRALYWPNPAVWHAGHRLEVERERACDDDVVADRIDPVRYAEYLVSLAWGSREDPALSALPFARRSSLAERVRSLLDRGQDRAPLDRTGHSAVWGLAALAVIAAVAIDLFGVVPPRAPSDDGAWDDGAALPASQDAEARARRRAAWAAGESEAPEHVDWLIEALGDPDPGVRVLAAWALGEIKDPRALEPVAARLSDGHARVREMAMLAIGEIDDPAGLALLANARVRAGSDAARAWALALLAKDTETEVFAGTLFGVDPGPDDPTRSLRQLRDPDAGTRARAAERLGRLGDPAAVDALLAALEDPDPAVRAVAIWALDEINPSREGTDPAG